jgi:hypothetical protein
MPCPEPPLHAGGTGWYWFPGCAWEPRSRGSASRAAGKTVVIVYLYQAVSRYCGAVKEPFILQFAER